MSRLTAAVLMALVLTAASILLINAGLLSINLDDTANDRAGHASAPGVGN